jgi:hypothetical protein
MWDETADLFAKDAIRDFASISHEKGRVLDKNSKEKGGRDPDIAPGAHAPTIYLLTGLVLR